MNIKMKKFIATSLIAGTALLGANAVSAAVTTNIKFDISDFVWFSNCTGQLLDITSGTEHNVYRTTLDGNGGAHLGVNFNLTNAKAVSASGQKYIITGSLNESLHLSVGVAYTFTRHVNLIALGNGGMDEMATQTTHVTVNANGTVTVNNTKSDFVCK